MEQWEYAILYLAEPKDARPERWILFTHHQDEDIAKRFGADAGRSTSTRLTYESDQARTTVMMGALGEDGWELAGTSAVKAIEATCLYFKRRLEHGRPKWTP